MSSAASTSATPLSGFLSMCAALSLAACTAASAATIRSEEGKFLSTVAAGAQKVQEAIEAARSEGRSELDGATVFRLYDTYGLPPEMVSEVGEDAEDRVWQMDEVRGREAWYQDRRVEAAQSVGGPVSNDACLRCHHHGQADDRAAHQQALALVGLRVDHPVVDIVGDRGGDHQQQAAGRG